MLEKAIEIVKNTKYTQLVRTTYDKDIADGIKLAIIEELRKQWDKQPEKQNGRQ